MAVVEPMLYIPHASPAALLFQFSSSDNFVPKEDGQEFFDTANSFKEIKWYYTSPTGWILQHKQIVLPG